MTAPIDAALAHRNNRPTGPLAPHLRGAPEKLDVPLSHYPETIRGEHLEKDAALLSTARAPLAAAKTVREKINTLIQSTTNRGELARASAGQMEQVTRAFDKVVPQLTARREAVEKEIATILTPSAPDSAAGEIRAHFKSDPSPFTAISNSVNAGDARTVAAVLGAPPFLSGLTNEQHDTLRLLARGKFAPAQSGLSADIERAVTQLKQVGASFVLQVGGAVREWSHVERDAEAIRKGFSNE